MGVVVSRSRQMVARETLSQAAAAAIRDMIVIGELPLSAPLRLDMLAERLSMSISPVREALPQLVMLGLVEHVAYRGATVTRLSLDEVEAIHEARCALESVVVRRVAERFTDEVGRELERLLQELEGAYEAGDRLRVVRGNTAFHRALAEFSGSALHQRLTAQIYNAWERYRAVLITGEHPNQTFAEEAAGHRQIVDACRRGDPEAAEEALRRHLYISHTILDRVSGQFLTQVDQRLSTGRGS